MRTLSLAVVSSVLALSTSPAFASAPLPVVAKLDKVTVEVSASSATVVLEGRYLIVRPNQNPIVAAGRMHYKCEGDKRAQCLDAWDDLLESASEGGCVGWGQMGDAIPNPSVLYSTLPTPTPWSVGMGVAELGKHRCGKLDTDKKVD
jgi:hypothetical protein